MSVVHLVMVIVTHDIVIHDVVVVGGMLYIASVIEVGGVMMVLYL